MQVCKSAFAPPLQQYADDTTIYALTRLRAAAAENGPVAILCAASE